ncbi:hypothetical protein IB262_30530 [Ensifer sp. ENS02]|uniref:hypothetical protein n=1 Tax=Ensifer sp. ENS02 TaxID=2769290 RepID=UPI00177D5E97|nr:hypothetical protein [Ensifer sp. ENS02]MBD9524227.1 hypothetical protein [Ensifer sp. ENS02]
MWIRRLVFGFATMIFFVTEMGPAIAVDQSVYLSLRNRIGLLRYCHDKGLLQEDAVEDAERRLTEVINGLPAADDVSQGDASEQAGIAGKWGQTGVAAEQRASMFGLTLKDQCAEWSK